VPFPFVLKPCCEDNSMGISMVEREEDLPAALAEAFKFDSIVVCEAFIPLGREIRVAVVEDDSGEPATVLPATEYLLTPEHPMRTSTDKITVTDSGLPDADKFFATNREEAPSFRRSICPAPLDDALAAKLATAAKAAHKALRCRDFSIYDFRVDPSGEVYMLECQPVCSFARESAMIGMALKTDVEELQHPALYHTMMRRAAARKPKPYDSSQVLGMKAL
jgi:D-alanine-D-alanine ligase